jgi:hypothetical protein
MKIFANCVGNSAAIVFQAADSGNAKGNAEGSLGSNCRFAYVMEALPMITPKISPKTFAGGMEFLVTVGLSALAGLLAFLLVSIVANILGLSSG